MFQGLTERSGYCEQMAVFSCIRAPFTDNVIVRDRDGFEIKGKRIAAFHIASCCSHIMIFLFATLGWGGAPTNSSQCACGTRGACKGDNSLACNCDSLGDQLTTDDGRLIDKNVLPVSSVCMGYLSSVEAHRLVKYELGNLVCSEQHFGTNLSSNWAAEGTSCFLSEGVIFRYLENLPRNK